MVQFSPTYSNPFSAIWREEADIEEVRQSAYSRLIATLTSCLLWAPSAISRFSNYAIVNGCFHEYHQILAKEVNARFPPVSTIYGGVLYVRNGDKEANYEEIIRHSNY